MSGEANFRMVSVRSDLASFIIDLEDEDCPDFGVHVCAYQGQVEELEELLSDGDVKARCLDARIRPFGATPLRLAATGVSVGRSVDQGFAPPKTQFLTTNRSACGLSRTHRMRRGQPSNPLVFHQSVGLESFTHLCVVAGVVEAVEVLLSHGADADRVDVKAQTPLFVAMVNQHWKCAE